MIHAILQKGFTLIELMIVIAIIGILSAISFPIYNNYTARAQVTEALLFASTIKTDISTSYFGQGWVSIGNYGTANSPNGKYVQTVKVDADGKITITMSDKANVAIRRKTLTLVPTVNPSGNAENIIVWACDSSAADAIPKNFLPSPCR